MAKLPSVSTPFPCLPRDMYCILRGFGVPPTRSSPASLRRELTSFL